MPRVKIDDLNQTEELSTEESKDLKGGMRFEPGTFYETGDVVMTNTYDTSEPTLGDNLSSDDLLTNNNLGTTLDPY